MRHSHADVGVAHSGDDFAADCFGLGGAPGEARVVCSADAWMGFVPGVGRRTDQPRATMNNAVGVGGVEGAFAVCGADALPRIVSASVGRRVRRASFAADVCG